MSKYADIEQIKKTIREAWVKYMPMEFDMNISFVLGKVAEVPTIDVVTCKECTYRENRMFEVDGEGICTETCLMFGKIIFNDSEFCNYGREE